jgi:hypothetical protein
MRAKADLVDDMRPRHVEPPGHRGLAVAVLALAIKDCRNPRLPRHLREQAGAFLAGCTWLDFWCSLAGLRAEAVRGRVASRAALDR